MSASRCRATSGRDTFSVKPVYFCYRMDGAGAAVSYPPPPYARHLDADVDSSFVIFYGDSGFCSNTERCFAR